MNMNKRLLLHMSNHIYSSGGGGGGGLYMVARIHIFVRTFAPVKSYLITEKL